MLRNVVSERNLSWKIGEKTIRDGGENFTDDCVKITETSIKRLAHFKVIFIKKINRIYLLPAAYYVICFLFVSSFNNSAKIEPSIHDNFNSITKTDISVHRRLAMLNLS